MLHTPIDSDDSPRPAMHTSRYTVPQAFKAIFGRQRTRRSLPGPLSQETPRLLLLVRFVGEHGGSAILVVVEDLLPRACCLEFGFAGWGLRLAVCDGYGGEVGGGLEVVLVGFWVLGGAVCGVGMCDVVLRVIGIKCFLGSEARAFIAGGYVSAGPDCAESAVPEYEEGLREVRLDAPALMMDVVVACII